MAELRTRIVLRNDSTAKWLENIDKVLLKGEVGIEFLADGKTKLKIGDGVKTWGELDYFGGESLIGDDVSVVIEDGIIKLNGFDNAVAGAQLIKGADGTMSWVLPDTTAIDNLTATVETLKTDVLDLRSIVGVDASDGAEATGLFALINDKANKDDVYTKDEVNGLVSSVYHYRGSKTTYADLPTEGQVVGDVWNIETMDMDHGIMPGDNVAWNGTSWDKLAGTIDLSGYVTTEQFLPIKNAVNDMPLYYLTKAQAAATTEQVKYEIVNTPDGTLVDYREKEIRVMCPADTNWVKQDVGATGDANMYYMGFKAYAPANAVSFKEGDRGEIIDQMFTFDDAFAGVDEFGRKYSICWFALASYDDNSDTWTYFGTNSSVKKYIGWSYVVEWYDANGVKIASDSIRINLSNESCHDIIEPYYMANVVKGVKVNGTLLDAIDGVVDITIPEPALAVKGSDEIDVAEDGTLSIKSVSLSKVVQGDEELVLNGGSAI